MLLQTILNRIEKQKGFVVSEARMTKAGEAEFRLQPRRGSRPICGSCGKKGATYDHTILRRCTNATKDSRGCFHIAKKFGEALDKVRAEEARQIHRE